MRRAGWPPSFVVSGPKPHAEEGGGLAPAWRNSVGQPFGPLGAAGPSTRPACGSVGTGPAPGCARRVMTSLRLPRLLGAGACHGIQVAGCDVG